MDFEARVKKFNRIHLIILISFSVVFFALWFFLDVKQTEVLSVENAELVMALQYAGIFLTFGGVVYGYHYYSVVLKRYKDSPESALKQDSFLKSKKVQNLIIYFVFIIDILFFGLTQKKQFELLSVVSLVICAVNFPAMSKYISDYEEDSSDFNSLSA